MERVRIDGDCMVKMLDVVGVFWVLVLSGVAAFIRDGIGLLYTQTWNDKHMRHCDLRPRLLQLQNAGQTVPAVQRQ